VRFLHTGDWHIGKAIRGRSRLDEFAAVLSEVVGIAVDEKVDALLLAGDIYEQRAPAPEADVLVFETFVQLFEQGIPVVAIPGNHDSAVRLEAVGKLLRAINVTMVPKVARPDEGGIVELRSRDGFERAQIACIPFIPERRYGDAASLFDSTADWYQSYAAGVGHLLKAYADALDDGAVSIVLAHLFAAGAKLGGGEREVSIGLNYAVPPSQLPGTVNYIALGHIHKPQDVAGAPAKTRYPGSLLQLDFGEVDQAKSVTIVDATAGKPPSVRAVPLRSGRRLLDVRGTLDELATTASDVGDAFLRVFVKTAGPVPGIADRVRELLPNAIDVHLEYERAEEGARDAALSSLGPRDQFLAYERATHGAEPHEWLIEAFDEVLGELTGETL
jgi:exonuclease SbcD